VLYDKIFSLYWGDIMSVKSFVEDAEFLWLNKRTEGAWTQALIATAATSKKRYPLMKDGEAFKKFIIDIAGILITGDTNAPSMHLKFYDNVRGDGSNLEDVLYKEFRCNMVHEATTKRVKFSKSIRTKQGSQAQLHLSGSGSSINGKIPDFWVLHIIKALRVAPENHDEFI
jgi:hypothetical protein